MNQNKKLASLLRQWANGKRIPDREVGICWNLSITEGFDKTLVSLVELHIKKWPNREIEDSGLYPVGGRSQYLEEQAKIKLWKNPKRRELCNWLADELEAGNIGG